jgi:hypothetical protein
MVLAELRAVRAEMGDVREDIGEVKGYQRSSLEAIRTLFQKQDALRDEVITLKAQKAAVASTLDTSPSTPPPTATEGLLSALTGALTATTELVKRFGEALGALMVLAVGLGLIATAPAQAPSPDKPPPQEMISPSPEP